MTRSAARPAAGPFPGVSRLSGAARLQGGAAVLTALVCSSALLGSPSRVEAHAIESSITRLASLSNGLLLSSQFGSGQPTVDAQVLASVLTAFMVGRLHRFARSGFKRAPTEHLEASLGAML